MCSHGLIEWQGFPFSPHFGWPKTTIPSLLQILMGVFKYKPCIRIVNHKGFINWFNLIKWVLFSQLLCWVCEERKKSNTDHSLGFRGWCCMENSKCGKGIHCCYIWARGDWISGMILLLLVHILILLSHTDIYKFLREPHSYHLVE